MSLCRRHSATKIAGLLIAVCLLAPRPGWTAVDPSVVQQILSAEHMAPPTAAQSPNGPSTTKIIDNIARMETSRLGLGNAGWSPSNPGWQTVYSRVYADLGGGMAAAGAAGTPDAAALMQDYQSTIAARLQPADAEAILSYFNSDPGKRYLAFLNRVNPLMAQGMATLLAPGNQPGGQTPVSPEQSKNNQRMLMLTPAVQMMLQVMKTSGDPSGGGATGFLLGIVARSHGAELQAIYNDYALDLPGFEIFSQSPPSQRFYAATGDASMNLARQSAPSVAWIRQTMKAHAGEWKTLYQTVTGSQN